MGHLKIYYRHAPYYVWWQLNWIESELNIIKENILTQQQGAKGKEQQQDDKILEKSAKRLYSQYNSRKLHFNKILPVAKMYF